MAEYRTDVIYPLPRPRVVLAIFAALAIGSSPVDVAMTASVRQTLSHRRGQRRRCWRPPFPWRCAVHVVQG